MVQTGDDDLVEYGYRRVHITITTILCTLLEIVDTTIVNVALTNMRGSLGATLNDVAWVITAYAIANVIVIVVLTLIPINFAASLSSETAFLASFTSKSKLSSAFFVRIFP